MMNPRKVLTPQQMGEVDAATIAAGIPGIILMENAAQRVVEYIVRRFSPVVEQRIVVVCGKGNNGGDGFVTARHLARWGMRVVVIALQDPAGSRDPAAANLRRLAEAGVRVRRFDPATLGRELDRADIAVDAIFGTGFAPFRGGPLHYASSSGAPAPSASIGPK